MAERTLPFLDGLDALPDDALAAARRAGAARFDALGLPGARSELFKYGKLERLTGVPFEAAPAEAPAALPGWPAPDGAHARLVLVNGRYRPDLSDLAALPAGVTVRGLADAAEDVGGVAPATGDDHPFLALNAALATDGVALEVPAGSGELPAVHLVHVAAAPGAAPIAAHPRVLLFVGGDSTLSVLEHLVGAADGPAVFTNAVTEAAVGGDGHLRHHRLLTAPQQAVSLFQTRASVGRDASFDSTSLTIDGGLTRTDTRVGLNAPGATARVNGATLGRDAAHADHVTRITHAAPHGTSEQTFKSVLDGGARAAYQGGVVVERDAAKTDARQRHDALLLSGSAEADGKPSLEIYNDDVACSHGNTMGRIDRDALFYLRARGIGEDRARALLVAAFADAVLDHVAPGGVRTLMRRAAHRWLDMPEDAEDAEALDAA